MIRAAARDTTGMTRTGTLRRVRIVVLAVVGLGVFGVPPSWAGPPTDDLKSYVDRVVAILDDPAMKSPAGAGARHRAVQAVANEGLDLNEAARRALASHWDTRTPS